MIDIKRLLEEPERVAQNNQNRGKSIDPQVAVALYEKRIALIEGIQTLRARGNEIAAKIPSVTSPDERKALVEEGKGIKEQVKEKEADLAHVESGARRGTQALPQHFARRRSRGKGRDKQ